jgi:hypothetical protein
MPASGAGLAGPAHTRQVHVSPVTSAGALARGYRVTSQTGGAMCEPGSEAIGTAYRCFAGNTIFDPCWARRAATPTVLCVAEPWLRTAAELRVQAPLSAIPAAGGPSADEPWAVQLASGPRCVLAQGAHNEFRGQVIDYYCPAGLSLLRGLGRATAVWTARSVRSQAGKLSPGPVQKIEIAWFGSPDRFR